MVAAATMAAQSHLQNKQEQHQNQQFLPRFPAGNAVDNNHPFASVTEPAFFAPDSTMIFGAAMTLPQHFPPQPQPQFLDPCGGTVNACTAAATVASTKRKRGREGGGAIDASVPGWRLATADLLPTDHHVDADVDALLRRHLAGLRAGLERSTRRHCRELVMALARQARSRIKAVAAELEAASRRNAELEARVRHVAAEMQAWFAVARDNEAVVAALRAGLEQAMFVVNNQNPTAGAGAGVVNDDDERFGDRCDVNPRGAPADDAQSCCFGGDPAGDHRDSVNRGTVSGWCRACHRSRPCRGAASVVVLPCRHLCLCAECDRAGADLCPVCGTAKTASIHVVFP